MKRDQDKLRRELLRTLDDELRRLPLNDRHPVACAAGCDFCCHLRVMATPVEVFGLLDFIRSTFDEEQQQAFEERVETTAVRLRGLPTERLLTTNVACPVLVDGRCSAYAARPFNCRSYHSLDRDACERSFNDPEDRSLGHPEFKQVARVHASVQGRLRDRLVSAGADGTQYELVTALAEAIGDPTARDRYGRGDHPVFRRTAQVIM